MSVDDWARRFEKATWEADDRQWRAEQPDRFDAGVKCLADLLLSDEAVDAAAWELLADYDSEHACGELREFLPLARAALQAALDAVTKEDGNE